MHCPPIPSNSSSFSTVNPNIPDCSNPLPWRQKWKRARRQHEEVEVLLVSHIPPQALAAQKKDVEAAETRKQFDAAWSKTDVQLASAAF